MAGAVDRRRCALQALYQFDLAGTEDLPLTRQTLEESGASATAQQEGFALAEEAWAMRSNADAAITPLVPDWPIHRQPAVDRNILRLAWFELTRGETPPKVVINEAIELAREFSTERSPLFVNGVLDRIYRQLRGEVIPADAEPVPDPVELPTAADGA